MENLEKHTYFVQAPFDVAIIENVQQKMDSIIKNIIHEVEKKEGIDLTPKENVALFFFKKRAAITTYYVNDMFINGESFLFSSLNALKNKIASRNATISSIVDFFGEQKEDLMALIDLVVKIDDPEKGLFQLNLETKSAVHNANEQYKNRYKIDMYDVAKSEKYPYLPHLTLGHLRANYIKHLIDAPNAEEIVERIKQRILQAASQVLSELSTEERKIIFSKLSVYDLKKRVYIYDVLLAA